MSSLNATMDVALGALQAQQDALAASSNNIANVNTPGYSREVANFTELPSADPATGVGGGVTAQIQSVQDSVLELQLNQENQNQTALTSYLNGAQQSQTLFNDSAGSGLQGVISNFFGAWQQLSTNPTDGPTRQSVLLAANNLTQAFNSTANSLSSQQSAIDNTMINDVSQVNVLTQQVASLNTQISQLNGAGQDTGSLIDQRTQAIRQLSGLIDVQAIPSGNGEVTVTTNSGAALVVGSSNVALTTQVSTTDGHEDIYDQGADITSTITGGDLGGNLQVRDQTIPGLLSSLDQLAAGISNAVNQQQTKGQDISGTTGTALFSTPPAGVTGAAMDMTVQITDPNLLAASSDGSAGSGDNATAMAALANTAVVNGQTPGSAYTNLVSTLGSQISNATSEQQASSLVLQQLESERSNISGVNMDEEAANLIQYERAYQAAARVANVVDTLTQTLLAIGSTTT